MITLITPLTALEPHSVAPGPRITSIRSTSSSGRSCTSQKTPANSGRVDGPPVHQNQQLVGRLLGEAAGGDRPIAGCDPRDLEPRCEPQRLGERARAGPPDVVPADDEHRRGGPRGGLEPARRRGDADPGKLFDIEIGERIGWRGGLLGGQREGGRRGTGQRQQQPERRPRGHASPSRRATRRASSSGSNGFLMKAYRRCAAAVPAVASVS